MAKVTETRIPVRVTSQEFKPGFDTNRRIADLMGIPVENEVPDYCESPDLTANILESRCDTLTRLEDVSGASVLVFDHLDGLCVASGASWAHTLASALLCSLEESPKRN